MFNAPWSMSPRRSTVVAARLLAALLLALSIFSQAAWAQDPAAPVRQRPLELPPEEVVSFDTKDGVRLVATYYPGTKGKDSVPIIMLHGSMGNRADFHGLARHMQEQGHAVIVPDLRGHGESTIVQGTTKKLSADTMPVRQYAYMVQLDVERVKSFLLDQHRDQKLNIDKLVVVGAEVGALIAMNWTAIDWSWPVLATGKQGQDVKAVVLISPVQSDKGLRMTTATAHPAVRKMVSVYIVMGSGDPKFLKESRQLYKALERDREKPDDPEQMTLFIDERETQLQGTSLLGEPSLELQERIAAFIQMRVINQNIPWKERRRPL